MKTFLAAMLASSVVFADPPADAPSAVTLTPELRVDAVKCLACEKDLRDCKESGTVSPMWLALGIGAGVLSGVAIGFAAGAAWKR